MTAALKVGKSASLKVDSKVELLGEHLAVVSEKQKVVWLPCWLRRRLCGGLR